MEDEMVYSISSYSQEQLVKWKLDANDALIIRWFVTFMKSGKMAEVEYSGQTYYWVKYQAVIDELPILKIKTTKGIAARFRKIVRSGLLSFYLKKNDEGTYSTYRLNQDQYSLLVYHPPMETKKPTGEKLKPAPMAEKRQPKDSITNKTIIQNDDGASIILEDDDIKFNDIKQNQGEKLMVHDKVVPPDSPDDQYQSAVRDLVNAYNKAALKAKYPNASPKNIATFYKNVHLNEEMVPLLIKHMDEWFRWNGRNNDVDKLGDRSISMLAYNLRPFYEYIDAIPTEEQITERKKQDLAPEIAGWDEDSIRAIMKQEPLLEWTEEAKLFSRGDYDVDLENKALVFPNGTIVTRKNKDEYIRFRDMEYGREGAVKRARARLGAKENNATDALPRDINLHGNLTLGGFMKASSDIMDHLDDD